MTFKLDFNLFRFSCWLSVENGVIWAFVGPAMVIIVVSISYRNDGKYLSI